jgi:hypothetical protein
LAAVLSVADPAEPAAEPVGLEPPPQAARLMLIAAASTKDAAFLNALFMYNPPFIRNFFRLKFHV